MSSINSSSKKGGAIQINALNDVQLSGASINTDTVGTGTAGRIAIHAGNKIELSDSSLRANSNSSSEDAGQAGEIKIETTNEFTSKDSFIFARGDRASGGLISIKAGKVLLEEETFVTTTSFLGERGGEITIEGNELDLMSNSIIRSTAFAGTPGPILVKVKDLNMSGGSRIESETNGGSGAEVVIEAKSINLAGTHTGISSAFKPLDNNPNAEGNAGNIMVTADELQISDGAQISAETSGAGNGGSIMIRAGRFVVQTGGEVTAKTSATGQGGSIDIQATDLLLRDRGSITAKSTGTGDSGSINITQADTVSLLDNSEITVTTDKENANAGNITINAKTLLHLRNKSAIETSAAVTDPDGRGSGGDITIDPKIVVLSGESKISANAEKGKAGKIRITITDGGALFQSPDSAIEASAGPAGIDGTVEIIRTDSDVIRGTLVLPETFLDAAKLLSEKCMARTAAGASSFVVSGRAGVPPGPDALLPDYASVLDDELVGEQGEEAAYTLPVTNLGSAQSRLSRLIIECNPKLK